MGEEVDLREIRDELAQREHGAEAMPPPVAAAPPPKLLVRPTLLGTLSAIPDFLYAGAFLLTWVNPLLWRTDMVKILMLVMLFEFISIHSSAFMGGIMMAKLPTGQKIGYLGGFGVLYSLFAVGFGAAFHAWWPFVSLWMQVGNRSLGLLVRGAPDHAERQEIRKAQAAATLAYLLFAFATTLLPVPALGITREVVGLLQLPGSGLWVAQPYRVIAFGFCYFLAVGLSEMVEHRWLGEVKAGTMTINGRDIPMED